MAGLGEKGLIVNHNTVAKPIFLVLICITVHVHVGFHLWKEVLQSWSSEQQDNIIWLWLSQWYQQTCPDSTEKTFIKW